MATTRDPESDGEKLFAQYLSEVLGLSRGTDWEFEPEWSFTSKRPDFFVKRPGGQVVLDVKEFEEQEMMVGVCAFDPYAAIRAKIDDVVRLKQLKPFANRHPCALVLRSGGVPWLDTQRPEHILGAMLGDEAWQWPVGTRADTHARRVFRPERGRMFRNKGRAAQNTTISAILDIRFRIPLDEAIEEGESVLRTSERVGVEVKHPRASLYYVLAGDSSLNERVLCVTAHANPLARLRLPSSVFSGPFDSAWGPRGDEITETFAGSGLIAARERGECVARMLVESERCRHRLRELIARI
jgi:hypothetical protein